MNESLNDSNFLYSWVQPCNFKKYSSEESSPVPDRAEVEEPSENIPEQRELLVGEDTDQVFLLHNYPSTFWVLNFQQLS